MVRPVQLQRVAAVTSSGSADSTLYPSTLQRINALRSSDGKALIASQSSFRNTLLCCTAGVRNASERRANASSS